jgi:antitoxin component YwqK of YwqJK toxin-antitoxin module/cation transport regulator ChaC
MTYYFEKTKQIDNDFYSTTISTNKIIKINKDHIYSFTLDDYTLFPFDEYKNKNRYYINFTYTQNHDAFEYFQNIEDGELIDLEMDIELDLTNNKKKIIILVDKEGLADIKQIVNNHSKEKYELYYFDLIHSFLNNYDGVNIFSQKKLVDYNSLNSFNFDNNDIIIASGSKHFLHLINHKFKNRDIIYLDDDNIESISKLEEGKDIRLYNDGKLKAECTNYSNGKMDGDTVLYFENGNIKAIGKFKNDKLIGDAKLFYENSNLMTFGYFVNNKLNGKAELYHENGKKKAKGEFKDNRLHGTASVYNQKGDKIEETLFISGTPIHDFKLEPLSIENKISIDTSSLVTSNKEKHYIFGYGSLINLLSSSSTADITNPIYATIDKTFGYYRAWCYKHSKISVNAVGLRKGTDEYPSLDINGIIFEIVNPIENLPLFDKREVNYERREIPQQFINYDTDKQIDFNEGDKLWVYVPEVSNLSDPDAVDPVTQSYVDIILNGCLEFPGSKRYPKEKHGHARAFIKNTIGWNHYWNNDRLVPSRPGLFEDNWKIIDKLLEEELGYKFEERRLPMYVRL